MIFFDGVGAGKSNLSFQVHLINPIR